MTLRTLIADDEMLARKRLQSMLSADPEVEIVRECQSGREVIAAIKTTAFDLVLLDIQMPGGNGFEVIQEIGPLHMPPTVFVTAYDAFAIQAFEVHAIDYLLKPIEEDRLRLSLSRVKERLAARSALAVQNQLSRFMQHPRVSADAPPVYAKRLLVPDGAEEVILPVSEIEWIEAADDYVCIHAGRRSLILRETIKQLTLILDPGKFVRVHRSAIANVHHIAKIVREGRSEGWLVLHNGQRLKMSKSGWSNLLAVTGTGDASAGHS
ncbi:MAG TPA: LytTR family DNA-binding domain-containing protein [Acidobacteriaceae bacterium]|nr:LytTR family DNA-binding domain-containing protein [Acidobacteriaceae bacterium]